MDHYVLALEGFDQLEELARTPKEIERAAYRAINLAVDRGRTRGAEEMRKQVNFPANYFRGDSSRLRVTQRASSNKLEAIITGRDRPTSLARFARSTALKQRGGVMIQVTPGQTKTIKRGFLMPLKRGASARGNLGLAVRTKPGERPASAWKPKKINDQLWLLYGPSVDQVFRGVRDDIRPEVERVLQAEFHRQMRLFQ